MKPGYGFTLVEILITFIVVGFVIGGLLIPFSIQMDYEKIRITQKRLDNIKEALIFFALNHGHLPCPALDSNDGREAPRIPGGHVCNIYDSSDGYLPWRTLSVEKEDGWGRPFRYRVDGWFSNSDGIYTTSSNPIGATKSQLKITTQTGENLNLLNSKYHSNVVAVIFSCGKNGLPDNKNDADGQINSDALCTNPGTENEKINHYIQENYIENEFDDILVWLPRNQLATRLAMAGKWPR